MVPVEEAAAGTEEEPGKNIAIPILPVEDIMAAVLVMSILSIPR